MKQEDKIQQYMKTPRFGERRTTLQVGIGTHILVIAYARRHNFSVREATEKLITAGLMLEENIK